MKNLNFFIFGKVFFSTILRYVEFKKVVHFDSKIKENVLFSNLKSILWTLSFEKIAEQQQLLSDPLEN